MDTKEIEKYAITAVVAVIVVVVMFNLDITRAWCKVPPLEEV